MSRRSKTPGKVNELTVKQLRDSLSDLLGSYPVKNEGDDSAHEKSILEKEAILKGFLDNFEALSDLREVNRMTAGRQIQQLESLVVEAKQSNQILKKEVVSVRNHLNELSAELLGADEFRRLPEDEDIELNIEEFRHCAVQAKGIIEFDDDIVKQQRSNRFLSRDLVEIKAGLECLKNKEVALKAALSLDSLSVVTKRLEMRLSAWLDVQPADKQVDFVNNGEKKEEGNAPEKKTDLNRFLALVDMFVAQCGESEQDELVDELVKVQKITRLLRSTQNEGSELAESLKSMKITIEDIRCINTPLSNDELVKGIDDWVDHETVELAMKYLAARGEGEDLDCESDEVRREQVATKNRIVTLTAPGLAKRAVEESEEKRTAPVSSVGLYATPPTTEAHPSPDDAAPTAGGASTAPGPANDA